ncbi:MAG TPA: XRE family transcriptional regulator [Bacillota bacterium]|nr:XRE family transcriptional regulator [Bacillota bacterium]HOH09853.1 XRE family transcriptional regulator [Bacillota bacterium]HPI00734.1 XRE family transcriptional regulator [Bacillota bacterium]HQJ25241.1 XRE family transcriptional regulator [Bacillota bacterium]
MLILGLGETIRGFRKERNLTLKQISDSTGLSQSLISQAERDISSLSIGSLKKIADVLGVPLVAFFKDGDPEPGMVVRHDQRKKLIPRGTGIIYELLSPSMDCNIELIFNHYEEGATTGPQFYTHKGEEVGIVLSGIMEVTVGSEKYTLYEGDSIYFDSTIPHCYKNVGKGKLTAVWAISPPSF